jgi:hypothetical protein
MRNSMRVLLISAVAACVFPVVARADAGQCAAEAASLRTVLVRDAGIADRWNLGWRLGFTGAAVLQLGAAASDEFSRPLTQGLWVNGGKAAIAAGVRWAMPLRVPVPDAVADPCADLRALRAAAEVAGQNERVVFWLTHIGGFALNLAGAVVLADRVDWKAGALSFAISYPVGLLHLYTAPRGAWHAWRDSGASWTVGVTPHANGWLVGVAGTF